MLFILLAKKQDNSEIMLKWKKKQGGFFLFSYGNNADRLIQTS